MLCYPILSVLSLCTCSYVHSSLTKGKTHCIKYGWNSVLDFTLNQFFKYQLYCPILSLWPKWYNMRHCLKSTSVDIHVTDPGNMRNVLWWWWCTQFYARFLLKLESWFWFILAQIRISLVFLRFRAGLDRKFMPKPSSYLKSQLDFIHNLVAHVWFYYISTWVHYVLY